MSNDVRAINEMVQRESAFIDTILRRSPSTSNLFSSNLIDSNSDGVLDRAEWIVINNIMDFYLISEIL